VKDYLPCRFCVSNIFSALPHLVSAVEMYHEKCWTTSAQIHDNDRM